MSPSRLLLWSALLLAPPSATLRPNRRPRTRSPPSPSIPPAPVLRARTQATQPFTVAGPHGVLVGQQDGAFRILDPSRQNPLPLHHSRPTSKAMASPSTSTSSPPQSKCAPIAPSITYSHPAFTVRQIMFSPARQRGRCPDHRTRPDRPHRPLRVRLPPSHRLHLPLHPRAQMDVARTQRRQPRSRMGRISGAASIKCGKRRRHAPIAGLVCAAHRLPQPRCRSHHPRRRTRHPRALSGTTPDPSPGIAPAH